MAEQSVRAAIENFRQTSLVPFWKDTLNVTPEAEIRQLFGKSRMEAGPVRNLLDHALAAFAASSFRLEVREVSRSYGEPALTIQVVLGKGGEWDQAFRDAWQGIPNPNEWCLSDNAVRLLGWIRGSKNTGGFVDQNRIGKQAGLRGEWSYSRIETYLGEIAFKSPYRVDVEKPSRHASEYKLKLGTKEDQKRSADRVNPVFDGEVVRAPRESVEAFARMLETYVNGTGLVGDRHCVLLDIHSRDELRRVFPDLTRHDNTSPSDMRKFLERVRLAPGLSVAATLSDDAGGGWRIGAALEEEWTWEGARESIKRKWERKDPRQAYGISDRAARIVEWIETLHENEMEDRMTPCVEPVAKEQMGIEHLAYEQNSGALLEVLVEEINDRTPYLLRLIPWTICSRIQHRILVKKRDPDGNLVRQIQVRALDKGIALPAKVVEDALVRLWNWDFTPAPSTASASDHSPKLEPGEA